jgi:hypothetical protein
MRKTGGKKIIKIGVEFSKKKRGITNWKKEEEN